MPEEETDDALKGDSDVERTQRAGFLGATTDPLGRAERVCGCSAA